MGHSIRLLVSGDPVVIYACHCTICQTQSGSAFGLAKTHALLAMAAIGQNLLKAANKIKINPQAQAIA